MICRSFLFIFLRGGGGSGAGGGGWIFRSISTVLKLSIHLDGVCSLTMVMLEPYFSTSRPLHGSAPPPPLGPYPPSQNRRTDMTKSWREATPCFEFNLYLLVWKVKKNCHISHYA